jgi:hypothetical protein
VISQTVLARNFVHLLQRNSLSCYLLIRSPLSVPKHLNLFPFSPSRELAVFIVASSLKSSSSIVENWDGGSSDNDGVLVL